MALILIEGADRTGKSTLAKELQLALPGTVELIHAGAPKSDDPIDEYVAPIAHYRPGGDISIVLDRGYLGESIWPEHFGRDPIMGHFEQECIESWLFRRGCLLVLALREADDLRQAVDDGDEPLSGDQVVQAQIEFEIEARASRLPLVQYAHEQVPVPALAGMARAVEGWAATLWDPVQLDPTGNPL